MKRAKYFHHLQSSSFHSPLPCTGGKNIRMAGIADEFMQNTSIHGMRYIGERERHISERVIWLLIVTSGCVLSVYGCYQEWSKWNDSLILISRDTTVATHDPINFPTVTICGTNKLSKRKIAVALQEPKFSWMNYTLLAKTMRYLTKFDALVNPDESFQHLLVALKENNVNIEELTRLVHKVSPTCNDIFLDCEWKTSVVACDRLFFHRLTDDGFCCSTDFDALDTEHQNDKHNITIKFSFNRSSSASTVYEYGVQSALQIILDPNVRDNAYGTVTFDGFKVLLHNKEEFPDVVERGFIIGTGHENYVALNRFSVWYTSAIPGVSFEKRQCYVDGEQSLKYHQDLKYTRSSCLHECRADKIMEECRCFPYFINAYNVSMPKCSFEAYPCVAKFYGSGARQAIDSYCRCPATCNDQWFTTEISTAPLSTSGFPSTRVFGRIKKKKKIFANDSVNLIGLKIFFKYNAGDSFKMDIPFGNKELLASMGGLLGFGLGFSAISAVELCYFLCCRWCFRKKRNPSESIHCWTLGNVKFPSTKRRHQTKTVRVTPLKDGAAIAWINTESK